MRRLRDWWLMKRSSVVELPNGDQLIRVRGRLTRDQAERLLDMWRARA